MSTFPPNWTFIGVIPEINKGFGVIDCQGFSNVTVMAFSNAAHQLNLHWSMDKGINTDLIDASGTVLAGETYHTSFPIKSRYLEVLYVDPTGLGNHLVRAQCYLNEYSPFTKPFSLVNLGGGALIYDPIQGGVRSLESSDATISILELANTIDIKSNVAATSPYVEASNLIEPVKITQTSAITNGLTNAITGISAENNTIVGGKINSILNNSRECSIVGGESNLIQTNAANSCIIAASDNASLTGGLSAARCGMICTEGCSMTVGTNNFHNNLMIACETSSLLSSGTNQIKDNCVIMGGLNLTMGTGVGDSGRPIARTLLLGGVGNAIKANRPIDNSAILGGENNTIQSGLVAATGSGNKNNVILGGNLNTVGISLNQNVSGNVILGGSMNIIDDGINSISGGADTLVNQDGCVCLGDSTGVTTLTTSVANEFSARYSGGTRFFSNSTNTTGVSLAAGGSSWAVVSDKNKKENIFPCDGGIMLKKLKDVNVYCYNYKGNKKEQICTGPTAQEWHAQFGSEYVREPIFDEEGLHATDEEGEFMYTPWHPAKDPLKIEVMDMIGILMAGVKELTLRLEVAEDKIRKL